MQSEDKNATVNSRGGGRERKGLGSQRRDIELI